MAVPGRVFSVATSRTLIRHRGFHRVSSDSNRHCNPAESFQERSVKSQIRNFHLAFRCCSLRAFSPWSGRASGFSITRDCSIEQVRSFASQADGLGQSETFREYRIRQEIEQRRRALRELEDDVLRSQIEVADARFHLNLQELASLGEGQTFPSYANDAAKPAKPTAIAATKLLKSLTPHENIYTIPNILTFTRLIAAPAVGYAILTSQPALALGLFFYAGVTDAVDGYLARRFHQTTVVGTVIDPMADKLLMTIAVVCLAIQHTIPMWLAVVIIGRDVCLAISAIYFRYISLPPPKTFARYWDFSLPSAEVHPTEISKINTLLQLLLIGSAMSLPVLRENMPALVAAWNLGGVFEGWSYLVGATTVWSGLSYIGNKDAVKILSKKEIDEKMEVRDEGPLYRRK